MFKHLLLLTFNLLTLLDFLNILSEAKCYKHSNRNQHCCCGCKQRIGSATPSSTLPSSSMSSQSIYSVKSQSTSKPHKLSTVPPTFSTSSSRGTTKSEIRGNCTNTQCICSCDVPTNVTNGQNVGGILIAGSFDTTQLGQSTCNQSSITKTYITASQTSSIADITANPPITSAPPFCRDLCIRTLDGIYYLPEKNFYKIDIAYYCGPDNDPKACLFYGILIPTAGNSADSVSLISDDGKLVYQNRNNTEPLGPTSNYLKIWGATCYGCCYLSAAFVGPACIPAGTFL